MQYLIQTKYKIWDYFQDKIACHSLFIHNPAKALGPNMINKPRTRQTHSRGTKNMIQSTMERGKSRAHTVGLYLKQNMGWQQRGRRRLFRQHQ
jgi:hypothetical protein